MLEVDSDDEGAIAATAADDPDAALLSFEELIDGLCEDDVAGLSAQLGLDDDETDADGAAAAASAAEGASALDVTDDRDDRANAAAS